MGGLAEVFKRSTMSVRLKKGQFSSLRDSAQEACISTRRRIVALDLQGTARAPMPHTEA